MNKQESLKVLFERIYTEIKVKQLIVDEHTLGQRILVIRSANISIFKKCVEHVTSINPNTYFYVVSYSRDEQEIKQICGELCEVIEYPYEGPYTLANLKDQIDYIKSLSIDCHVELFNNRYGVGFENIEEILVSLNQEKLYAFNSHLEMLEIDKPSLHLRSLKLLNALAEWHWEQFEEPDTAKGVLFS